MRLVVDANILICVNGFDVWSELFEFLEECGLTLITIEAVYRRKIADSLRPTLDKMIEADHLALVGDPDKVVQQPKAIRKLQKKIRRKAKRCPPTSPVDQQLLLVALRDDHPLLTDERPLQDLADLCNVPVRYDLLDVIDALHAGAAIDEASKEALLSGNPGGREEARENLEAALAERGGPERFGCAETGEHAQHPEASI